MSVHTLTIIGALSFFLMPVFWSILLQKKPISAFIHFLEIFLVVIGINLLLLAWISLIWNISDGLISLLFINLIAIAIAKNYVPKGLRFKEDFLVTKRQFSLSVLGAWKWLLLPAIGLLLYRTYQGITFGDTAWDSNQQHLPIVYSMFQENNLRRLPAVGYFQNIPALPHLFSTVGLFVNGNISTPILLQSGIVFIFILFLIFWLSNLSEIGVLNRNTARLGIIAVVYNAPILMTSGTHYVDLFSQLYLLILCKLIFDYLRDRRLGLKEYLLMSVSIGVVVSSKVAASYQLIALFSFLILVILRELKKVRNLVNVALSGLFGAFLGSAFYVRNFQEFGNPFYPYTGVFHQNASKYLVDYPTMVSWIRNAAASQVQDMGQVSGMIWNWFKSDFVWLSEHIHSITSLIHGRSGFEAFGPGSVYALDARVVGSGITFNFIFLAGILSYLAVGIARGRNTLRGLVIFVPFFMAICVPNYPSMRYMWAAASFFLIISLAEIQYWKTIIRPLAILMVGLVLTSFSGASAATIHEYNYAKFQHSRLIGFNKLSPIYNPVGNLFDRASIPKCPVVELDSPLQSVGFASGLWLGSTCTKVVTNAQTFNESLGVDLNVEAVTSSEANQKCILQNAQNSMSLQDSWTRTILIFIKNSDLQSEKLRLSCLQK